MISAIILAGPQPENGGQIFTMSVFNGTTTLGSDFGQAYTHAQWQQNVEIPLCKFARHLFPEDIRKEHTLPELLPSALDGSGSKTTSKTTSPALSSAAASSSDSLARAPRVTVAASSKQVPPATKSMPAEKTQTRPKPLPKGRIVAHTAQASTSTTTAQNNAENGADGDNPDNRGDTGVEDQASSVNPNDVMQADDNEVDSQEWDNGEPLTFEERVKICQLLVYEREREMNKRRNARIMKELEIASASKDLCDAMVKKSTPRPRKKALSQPTSPTSTTLHRSSRRNNNGTSAVHPATQPSNRQNDSNETNNPDDGNDPGEQELPTWLDNVVEFLGDIDESREWDEMVSCLVKLGFPKGLGKNCVISSTHRPAELTQWVHSGKPLEKILNVDDKVFGKNFEHWWVSL
ncbi:hypothetical protein BJ138DRAFT_1120200 [Hygrophoropsis aurantiaca]|uniref:Uncharacterized protein n=1 Tax=Hygrophoropsis aurantiaca TaxID=72124 RepID=A0ACB7ZSE7_9AGAM|nr:hypothetical protein BJ138DRAFT_1120200 [Hygrophoropsis aurantiaca]